MKENLSPSSVRLRAGAVRDGVVAIAIEGRLDSNTTGRIWRQATETVANAKARSVTVDASQIDYCDGSGIALFVHLRNLQRKAAGQLEIRGNRTSAISSSWKVNDGRKQISPRMSAGRLSGFWRTLDR